jgi:multidrug resistance protein, MATE family
MRFALPGILAKANFDYLRRYILQHKMKNQTNWAYIIIAFSTVAHFYWCDLFIRIWEWGLEGAGLALTLTYSLNCILLYIVSYSYSDSRELMSFNFDNAFVAWGQYINYGLSGTFQLMSEWWYFEIPTLISGMFPDPAQLAASVILSNFALVTRKIPTGISIITTKDVNKAVIFNQVSVGMRRANSSLMLVLIWAVINAIIFFLVKSILPRLYSK